MATWIRFEFSGKTAFGLLERDSILVHDGEMLGSSRATGETLALDDVTILTPCDPGKMLALWNNFHATMEKTGLPRPEHPWYFVKTPNTYAPAGADIRRPAACSGKVLFEGELGIVIGRDCHDVPVEAADDCIFGYTCINDVTALEYLFREERFAHWTRAKCFDGFGVFGPGITCGVNPDELVVRTFLEGNGEVQERQNYPVSDMVYGPREIVSHISRDMTLNPGDIIACGTSVGAGALKDGWTVRVSIESVGELVNRYDGR